MIKIPLINLQAQYQDIKKEVDEAITKVLTAGTYILGPQVAALEEEIASYCGTAYGIGVASGTDALMIALMSLGVEPGDEVITTPYTFFASAEVISWLGATPVFVDIDPKTYNIDVNKIEKKITEKTKAILPVHIFGQIADMDKILYLAGKYRLVVIEDCCQAIGAEYKGRRAGSMGQAGCFSFFPSKNLGGYGDGGMIVTGDREMRDMARMLRVHGSSRKYFHDMTGLNSRLDELQAAVLRVKLRYLDKWHQLRREKGELYNQLFQGSDIVVPYRETWNDHVYHLYVIRSKKRDAVQKYLLDQGISCGVYYPLPLHLQPAFQYLGYREGDLPEAEAASRETLALPLYPELPEALLKQVAQAVLEGSKL
jgi:dTDP-4-amino-4,6-dideoxygalactose transaminase